MAKFMILHRYIGDPDNVYISMNDPELIKALALANEKTAHGKSPTLGFHKTTGGKPFIAFACARITQ